MVENASVARGVGIDDFGIIARGGCCRWAIFVLMIVVWDGYIRTARGGLLLLGKPFCPVGGDLGVRVVARIEPHAQTHGGLFFVAPLAAPYLPVSQFFQKSDRKTNELLVFAYSYEHKLEISGAQL